MNERLYFIIALLIEMIIIVIMSFQSVQRKKLQVIVWHKTSERLPTIEDADMLEAIWVMDVNYQVPHAVMWDAVSHSPGRYPYWTRTPGTPPIDDDKK
jgi:hypothetical protein